MDDSLPFLRNGYQGPEVHGTLAEGGIRTFRGPDPLETDSAPPRRIAHEVDRHTGQRTVGGLLLKRRRTLPTDKVNAIVDMGPEVHICEIACGRQQRTDGRRTQDRFGWRLLHPIFSESCFNIARLAGLL